MYEAAGGYPVDQDAVHFWEVLGNVKLAVIFLTGGRSFVEGKTSDLILAMTTRMIPGLEREIIALLEAGGMRPNREEMLAGLRRALVEYAAPEVKTVYGRTELTYAISLLATIARESEDAVAVLVQENADLRRLLRDAGRRLGPSGGVPAGLASELRGLKTPRTLDLRQSPLRDENARLLGLLIRLQAACEEAPSDRATRAVYGKTLAFLTARAEAQAGSPRRAG